jgi:hypothetical protein
VTEHGWNATGAPERPRANRGLIAAIAVAVLVLAVVGATAGWILAGRDTGAAGPGGTPPPSGDPQSTAPTAPATSTSAATSAPPATATATGGPATGNPSDAFPLPDVSGKDFEQARRELRELRLGVTVVFGSAGDDRTVSGTEPAAGRQVRRGTAIKLQVRGSAPYATIPGIVGVSCNQAGSIVADHGLVPQYPYGRSGVVLRTDPEQAPDRLRWNEVLQIYCGPSPTTPSG